MSALFGSFFGGSGPATPRGHRAYVIGDVHGRLDLLEQLLAKVEDDVRARSRMKTSLVFLGDLIDRGPDSAGVVERLRTIRPTFATPLFLSGNHEEVLLRVLDGDRSLFGSWMKFGGGECVASYGLDPVALGRMIPDDAIALVKGCIPENHVLFIQGFADSITFGSYLFVHAGIRPGTNLIDQATSDMRWIRQPFLDDERDHGVFVVHGHTIREEVDIRTNRIGIDTGAYRTGVLTALALEGRRRWVLQTDDAGKRINPG